MCMSGRKIKTLTNMIAEILYCFFGNLPQGIRAKFGLVCVGCFDVQPILLPTSQSGKPCFRPLNTGC